MCASVGAGMAGRRRRQWTLALVSAAALLERADEAVLPAVYAEVSAALGATPAELGTLTLCRSIVQALCYPLAAWAAARYDRARVVAVGAILWAAATFLVGASGSVLMMGIARAFNGVGLAIAVPAIYSLVADYTDDATRGSAFGWVVMGQTLGFIGGSCSGLLLAPTSFLGVPGWRLAFYAVALVSVSLAALVWLFAADPRPAVTKAADPLASLADVAQQAKHVVTVPTFLLLVALGVIGSVPWSAFSFITMWLELVGFTHTQTSVIISLASVVNLLGILFAGYAGDNLARRFPKTGRVALAQACNALTVPLAAALLLAFPGNTATMVPYAAVGVLFAFTVSWVPVSTINPIYAEIVSEKARTTVYALGSCIGSVLSSFGSPLVGVLAERVFGYNQDGTPGASAEADRKNADALGKAIFWETAVPATICCLTYAALYWTYPADKQRAQLAASQLQAGSEDQDGDCEADGLNEALLPGTGTG